MRTKNSSILLPFILIISILFVGCTTVSIPQYLEMEHAYQRQFSANFDQVLSAALETLSKFGWRIDREEASYLIDNAQENENQRRQVVLFTRIKQKALFLASRYSSLNVIIKELDQSVSVQIVYFSVLSTAFRNTETYKNDDLVNNMFSHIQMLLK
jgi:hypothetical protein